MSLCKYSFKRFLIFFFFIFHFQSFLSLLQTLSTSANLLVMLETQFIINKRHEKKCRRTENRPMLKLFSRKLVELIEILNQKKLREFQRKNMRNSIERKRIVNKIPVLFYVSVFISSSFVLLLRSQFKLMHLRPMKRKYDFEPCGV